MIKKIILFVLSLLLIISTPSYAQNVSTATQSELEAVYAGLAQNPPSSLTPNTIEHKASRWEQYKEEKSSTGSAPIAYIAVRNQIQNWFVAAQGFEADLIRQLI
jgi:hypothetical protein